jgi:DNA replication protein DnaC
MADEKTRDAVLRIVTAPPTPPDGEHSIWLCKAGPGCRECAAVELAAVEKAIAERARDARRREEEAKARAAEALALALKTLPERGVPAKALEALAGPLRDSAALRAARAFTSPAQTMKTILVLCGDKGCGKTVAGALCCTQAPLGARFIEVSRLARIDRYSEAAMGPLETCSVLVIDDLGAEFLDEKGGLLSKLDGIINTRYASNLKTVLTTNVPAAIFAKRYGERIADRIREVGEFVEISDPSFRSGGSR